MATHKVATGLNEQGRRTLMHFLANHVKDGILIRMLDAWERDVSFNTASAHIEVSSMYTTTHNPEVCRFESDEIEFEDVEDDE